MRHVEAYIAAWIADEEHRRRTGEARAVSRFMSRTRPQCAGIAARRRSLGRG